MKIKTFMLNNNLNNLDKLSCHNYEPDVLNLLDNLKKKGILLSELAEKVSYSSGKWELTTEMYIDEKFPNRIKLLQISNINEIGEIVNTQRDKYISNEIHQKWKTSQIKKNDLIVSIAAVMGRIAIFKEDYEANLNQNLAFVRLKKEYNNIKIIPEFIHLYLNSFYAETQFNFFGGNRAGQSSLSLQEIKDIYIILPSEKEQLKIIDKLNKIGEEANKHYQNFLKYSNENKNKPLNILKIKLPDEEERKFISKKNIDGRIDAIFNSPFREKLIKNLKNNNGKKLNDFLELAKNKFEYSLFYNIVDLDDIDENVSIIKSYKQINNLNSSKSMLKKENILISKLGGEKGNVILIDEEKEKFIGSGELIAFKLKENSEKNNLIYILNLLRSPYLSKQIEYTLTGCSRMRINQNEMLNLIIPYPKNEQMKDQIIKECEELRNKAIYEKKQYENKKKEVKIEFKKILNKYLN